MKIHFCDLCNESVPQADLDQGRARLLKGRVICSTCERAMSHPGAGVSAPAPAAAPAPFESGKHEPVAAAMPPAAPPAAAGPAPVQSSSPGLWMAALALLATAGAIYVFQGRIDALAGEQFELAKALAAERGGVRALEERLARFPRAQAELERQLSAQLAESVENLKALGAELAREKQAAEKTQVELTDALASLRELQQRGRLEQEQRLDELSHRIAQGEDGQRQLRERLAEYEASAEDARKRAESAAAAAPPAAAPSAPAWQGLLGNLSDDNPSTRWEAVDELGRSKDAAVVPHVLPMLRDADLFVRMCAARVLGDLGSLQAVAGLIDALEDAEPPVRESAGSALRTLTGKDFKFDPQGSEADRARKVKLWREWWKKESEAPATGTPGTPSAPSSGTQKS